jgi:hypothetical protein
LVCAISMVGVHIGELLNVLVEPIANTNEANNATPAPRSSLSVAVYTWRNESAEGLRHASYYVLCGPGVAQCRHRHVVWEQHAVPKKRPR